MEGPVTTSLTRSPKRGYAVFGLVLILALAGSFFVLSSCRTGDLAVKLDQKIKTKEKPAPDDVKEHAATGFPLEGRHADYHKGSAARDCYVCHRQPAWTVNSFNHNTIGFPLMGAHRAFECGDCHRDVQSFRITPRPNSCAVCHESAYRSASFPHANYGAGKNCQECHLQDTWNYAHSPFWFNIQTGSMAGLECASCHKTAGKYADYTCHDCHKGHAGDRNGRCMDCHPGGPPIKGEAKPAARVS